ncbi:MAG: hypothetical protein ACRDWH_01810 [Acidimicrobiia bacterium]
MRKTAIAVLTALMMIVTATTAYAEMSKEDAKELRTVTARYHSLTKAIADGYQPFSIDPNNPAIATCFDSNSGGMGIHYVRNIDAVIDPSDPEALVYEVAENGQPRLVAVEYIIPEGFVEDALGNPVNLPSLFGHEFHKHSFLPVYILHAWIWRTNPDDMFSDFNPDVAPCPGT